MENGLTITEAAKLENLEEVIRGLDNALQTIGRCLREIRDERLYRQNFASFDDYCSERWNFTRQRASQLIQHFEKCDRLSTVVDTSGFKETQTRLLNDLPEDQQAEAVQDAVETAASESRSMVTNDIKQAVEKRKPPKEPKVLEVDLQKDVEKEAELESDDEQFRTHVNAIRVLVDNRHPAQLIGWDQDIKDLHKHIGRRRNGL